MKKTGLILTVIILLISFSSCNQNTEIKKKPSNKFEQVKELAKYRNNELFGIFDKNISKQEANYLEFLYSYMPLSDLADYDGKFYLNHVRTTINARNSTKWGKAIPEDVFQHFVLPHRVNNENLDTARIVFFNELKGRIKNLSMYDAVLEVNHWCHEKVEYHSADGRTSSPLATMKTAYGRCGEESTFAVAAMRSVCIPARQVYTPRWAHSDDNHAWVEVWADGKWYFLGACEPEPVLNFGWFNESASRAILVHARAFGDYKGKEEVNVSTSQYNDINVITRYAHTHKQFIKVINKNGEAVANAKVEYQLYNYAEFYPITTKHTNMQGLSYLTTGLGELLIWVSNANNYGFQKIKIGEQDTVNIVMNNPEFKNTNWELMPPPISDKLNVELTDKQINSNKKILQYEDSIRNNYVLEFISQNNYNLNNDSNLWSFVKNSRGNYKEIITFISANKDTKWVKPMLNIIAKKDLRDTKAQILTNHLINSMAYVDKYSADIFTKYILNPRIELEMLLAYKEVFNNNFNDNIKLEPKNLIKWIKDSIEINNDAQAYNIPITPIGVYMLRVANNRSVNIFFVATCRSFGIPARLEPGTNVAQYFNNDKWIDVFFDIQPKQFTKFDISFNVKKKDLKFTPQYYHHFTLAIFENNRFNTIELGEYQDIDKIEELKLKSGTYRLITSNRLSSGKILVDIKFLNINADTKIDLEFPEGIKAKEIVGSLNREKLTEFINCKDIEAESIQEKTDIVVAIIRPDKEPTKHILMDIQKIKKDFEKLNNTIVFIIQKKDMPATFKIADYSNLPYRSFFKETDQHPSNLLDIKIVKQTDLYPKIMIVNPKGQIYYYNEGYKIGIGDELLKSL